MFGQRQAMHETIMEMKLNFHSYKSEFICPFICHSYRVNHSEGGNYCYKHFILTGLLEEGANMDLNTAGVLRL